MEDQVYVVGAIAIYFVGCADLIGNFRFGLAYDKVIKNAAGLPATAADSQSQSKYSRHAGFEKGAYESPVKHDFTSLGWNMEPAVSQQRLAQGLQANTKKKPPRAAFSQDGMPAKRLRQRICPDVLGPIHRIGAFHFVPGGRHASGTRNYLHGPILLVVFMN